MNGFERIHRRACRPHIAIGIIILLTLLWNLTVFADASANQRFMHWRPFKLKQKLLPKAYTSKKDKQNKWNGKQPVVSQHPVDFREPQTAWSRQTVSEAQGVYMSKLSAPAWSRYFGEPGISALLAGGNGPDGGSIAQEMLKHSLKPDDPLPQPYEGTAATIKDNSLKPYLHVSFFKHDWLRQLSRDAPGREMSRYNAWEMLLTATSHHQSMLDTVGRIFEPKIDLRVEF
jgi:hypothetical protein